MNSFGLKGNVKKFSSDITSPMYSGLRLILNFCNVEGENILDYQKNVMTKWSKVKEETRKWYLKQNDFKLGNVSDILLNSDTWIVNCVVFDKNGNATNKILDDALKKVKNFAKNQSGSSLHLHNELLQKLPELQALIDTHIITNNINVYIYGVKEELKKPEIKTITKTAVKVKKPNNYR